MLGEERRRRRRIFSGFERDSLPPLLYSPLPHPGPSAVVLFLDQVGFGTPYIRTVCVSRLVYKINNASNMCSIGRTTSLSMWEEEKSHLSSGSLIYAPWNGY